ncbi:MAG: site-specific integrase [Bdellovibrionaceae bacterium]|nr:site-specific integrase [Pseudobdellovibrionaceae bacterium]
MACITKRRGKWVVDYRIGSKRYIPSFSTKGEAEVFLRELKLRKIDSMTGFTPLIEKSLTQGIQEYLTSITPQKSERTAEVDKIALDELDSAFPNALVQDVTSRELEYYKVQLLKKFQPATVNRRFNVIRHFFGKCTEWKYLSENPTKGIKRVTEIMQEKKTLGADEIKVLIENCPQWVSDILLLISRTGVRRNEAINLEWTGVNFENRTISIFSIKGGVHRKRELPMTQSIFELFMRKWNERQQSVIKSNRVFLNQNQIKINPRTLSSAVSKAGKKIGIENAGLHILRHTILTDLSASNQSGSIIQKLAGHSSLMTTQRYLHHGRESLRKSLEALEVAQNRETQEALVANGNKLI